MSTIAAISTALGNSGINIIRISGKESLDIIKKIFTQYDKLKPNNIIYGKIKENDRIIDNVLVSYFKEPYSFTGEDIIEINCHGGTYITKKILQIVLENGAVLAEPGEFSKRAFLNGKIDLSEAEGIINLINAKTKLETEIATLDVNGKLFNKVKELKDKIIEMIAHIEVTIDYPEYDYEEVEMKNLNNLLDFEISNLNNLINSYEEGKYIKNGVNVVLLGKPNVGKSSLLNCLANNDRAIVTNIAGTTRDVIEETINIGDVILNVFDTAGIRETQDVIEKIGVDKTIKQIDNADLIIYLIDNNSDISDEDKENIKLINNKNKKLIILFNKVDKDIKSKRIKSKEYFNDINVEDILDISIKDNMGIDNLKNKITNMFLKDTLLKTNEVIIVNERHRMLLIKALENINIVKNEIIKGVPLDLLAINLKESAKNLGEIIGTDVSKDVVETIFKKFCLGK